MHINTLSLASGTTDALSLGWTMLLPSASSDTNSRVWIPTHDTGDVRFTSVISPRSAGRRADANVRALLEAGISGMQNSFFAKSIIYN